MMDSQEHNLCLLNMSELVLDRILVNIHNPSNVSRTCKYLYEIIYDMEKRRRVMHISALDAKSPLNIDTDAVFDSMINSQRTIKEIEIRVGRLDDKVAPSYELNERQFKRMIAIMKRFGSNVTSLKLHGFVLPINFILKSLQEAPKLEFISFTCGKVMGSLTENPIMSLQLTSLKELNIKRFSELLDVVNLIPAGSLNSIRYTDHSTESVEVLATILTKQHNIKSLTLDVSTNSDLTALCVDHVQLETLIFETVAVIDVNSQFMEILKCQTNLKELRFTGYCYLRASSFQWICNNLKKLEVFEVQQVDSTERNPLEMLGELKQLRHFWTFDVDNLFDNGLHLSQFKSDSIEKLEFRFWPMFRCGELLTKMVNSIALNLPNLTHLQMNFENFSALCFVLSHCTKIVHLTCSIIDPIPDQLTQQSFPNIQSLELRNDFYSNNNDEMLNRCMTPIVRAMPNLRSMSLLTQRGFIFDVKTMNEFVKESRSLDYLCVDRFELHRKLCADDVVVTIRCLIDQLKGNRINFRPSASEAGSNFDKIKDILHNECYVRDDYRNRSSFYLYKDLENKYRAGL